MKNHLRNLQSGVAFCLCLVAVRKRIYGLRQTQNALKIDFGFLLLVESLRTGFIFHRILIYVLDFLKFLYNTQDRN